MSVRDVMEGSSWRVCGITLFHDFILHTTCFLCGDLSELEGEKIGGFTGCIYL